jgi:eukaryotic-like serine/threonine-protein kinase
MPENRSFTSKEDTTEVSPTPTSKSTGSQKKRRWLPQVLIALAILVIISSIIGLGIYQNNANVEKADNAYLSDLSQNGTLALSDPLNQERGSQWQTDTNGDTTCQWTSEAYHIKPQGKYFKECDAIGTYSNFAFEINMTIIQGNCAGIVFRSDKNGNFYYFAIYQDGKYDIARYADYGIFEHLLPYGHSTAIHTGLGQQNKIAVRANSSTLTFYVNEQQIQKLNDESGYTSGSIGLAAYPNFGNGADISFSNARLWTL